MATSFLYYIPSLKSLDGPALKKAGLSYCFDEDTPRTPRVISANGLDDGPGIVVAHEQYVPTDLVKINREAQTWRKIPGSTVWVGMYTDDRPSPDQLLRDSLLDGADTVLADGNAWLIPIVRALIEEGNGDIKYFCRLPKKIGVNAAGDWVRDEVIVSRQALWLAALSYWDHREASLARTLTPDDQESDEEMEHESIAVRFDFPAQNDAALLGLSANYRVGKAEVALLELFTDETTSDILEIMVDAATWRILLAKKNAPASDG